MATRAPYAVGSLATLATRVQAGGGAARRPQGLPAVVQAWSGPGQQQVARYHGLAAAARLRPEVDIRDSRSFSVSSVVRAGSEYLAEFHMGDPADQIPADVEMFQSVFPKGEQNVVLVTALGPIGKATIVQMEEKIQRLRSYGHDVELPTYVVHTERPDAAQDLQKNGITLVSGATKDTYHVPPERLQTVSSVEDYQSRFPAPRVVFHTAKTGDVLERLASVDAVGTKMVVAIGNGRPVDHVMRQLEENGVLGLGLQVGGVVSRLKVQDRGDHVFSADMPDNTFGLVVGHDPVDLARVLTGPVNMVKVVSDIVEAANTKLAINIPCNFTALVQSLFRGEPANYGAALQEKEAFKLMMLFGFEMGGTAREVTERVMADVKYDCGENVQLPSESRAEARVERLVRRMFRDLNGVESVRERHGIRMQTAEKLWEYFSGQLADSLAENEPSVHVCTTAANAFKVNEDGVQLADVENLVREWDITADTPVMAAMAQVVDDINQAVRDGESYQLTPKRWVEIGESYLEGAEVPAADAGDVVSPDGMWPVRRALPGGISVVQGSEKDLENDSAYSDGYRNLVRLGEKAMRNAQHIVELAGKGVFEYYFPLEELVNGSVHRMDVGGVVIDVDPRVEEAWKEASRNPANFRYKPGDTPEAQRAMADIYKIGDSEGGFPPECFMRAPDRLKETLPWLRKTMPDEVKFVVPTPGYNPTYAGAVLDGDDVHLVSVDGGFMDLINHAEELYNQGEDVCLVIAEPGNPISRVMSPPERARVKEVLTNCPRMHFFYDRAYHGNDRHLGNKNPIRDIILGEQKPKGVRVIGVSSSKGLMNDASGAAILCAHPETIKDLQAFRTATASQTDAMRQAILPVQAEVARETNFPMVQRWVTEMNDYASHFQGDDEPAPLLRSDAPPFHVHDISGLAPELSADQKFLYFLSNGVAVVNGGFCPDSDGYMRLGFMGTQPGQGGQVGAKMKTLIDDAERMAYFAEGCKEFEKEGFVFSERHRSTETEMFIHLMQVEYRPGRPYEPGTMQRVFRSVMDARFDRM